MIEVAMREKIIEKNYHSIKDNCIYAFYLFFENCN